MRKHFAAYHIDDVFAVQHNHLMFNDRDFSPPRSTLLDSFLSPPLCRSKTMRCVCVCLFFVGSFLSVRLKNLFSGFNFSTCALNVFATYHAVSIFAMVAAAAAAATASPECECANAFSQDIIYLNYRSVQL